MLVPYDAQPRPGLAPLDTPANSAETIPTRPNTYNQTTAADMGTLLAMIYYCAQGQGGALGAVYPEQLTAVECQEILNVMMQNQTDSLIEEGVPPTTPVAHRHGWISDTHGDAGVVFSPGGDYVLVEFLYKPDWLEWVESSPILRDISQATYNFFNFDDPYLGDSRVN
jgi:beta-lactamase class A